ncbi:MAG TPA: esterase [Prolixibacteraceae bacterium]|nr:esterase [Prolixibacteraceae bacterium]
MNRLIALLLVAFFFACTTAPKTGILNVNSVQLKTGKLSGKTSDDQLVKIFMGVPFAAPPVGDLRWKAPQPVASWEGVRACVTPPPSAMQAPPKPFMCWSKEFMAPENPLSEDCLYLNVWTAAKTVQDKLPVMVWIHGGAFTGGSGTVPLYDGEAMSRKGVVFVTINYRLGIFGFLAHPGLSAESDLKTSGNYGILDQIAALKWVKENIAAFGGDPNNVTIAGQSAGAFSVNMLVVSPMSKGLFHKAIAQSGGMFGKELSLGKTLKAAEESGTQLTEKMKITSIAELRAIPADSLLKIPGRFGLVIDDVVIPPVYKTFAEGKHHDVPVISGWNADDGVSFGPPPTAKQFKANAKSQFGDKADTFLKLFPVGNDEEAGRSQKLVTQLFFGWNNYAWARMQSSHGTGKAYLYYFKRVPPGEPNYGAFHSAEFGYALHTMKLWNRPFTEVDFKLEEAMSSYWVNFARTGNPNGEGLPVWPVFNDSRPEVIELGDEVKAGPLPYQEQLNFLNEVN